MRSAQDASTDRRRRRHVRAPRHLEFRFGTRELQAPRQDVAIFDYPAEVGMSETWATTLDRRRP